MASPIQLSNEDVKLLRDHQLVRLLCQLLYVELRTHGIDQYDSQVPLSVYIKDGGIDGIARWSGGQPSTAWLPSRLVGFQAKAADMDARACGKEVLAADGTLKPQVQRLVVASGSYILFLARDCVEQSKQPRIEAIRTEIGAAMTKAGQPLATPPDVRIYDASDIAAWANLYPAVVAHVFECLGRAGSSDTAKQELAALDDTGAQVSGLPVDPAVPVWVLSAVRAAGAPSALATDAERKRADISQLYPGSTQVWVDSGHGIPLEKPQAVVGAIREAVRAARASRDVQRAH